MREMDETLSMGAAPNARIDGLKPIEKTKDLSWKGWLYHPKARRQLVRLLERTPVFAGTSAEFRDEIIGFLEPAEYVAGEVIFKQGDVGNWMGILMNGKLSKRWERNLHYFPLDSIECGEMFGDLGMFGIYPERSFTLVASTDCQIVALSKEMFRLAVGRKGCPHARRLLTGTESLCKVSAGDESFLSLDCFQRLESEFVLALLQQMEPRMYYPNQVMFKEGQVTHDISVLRSGSIRLEKDGRSVTTISDGAVLGEFAEMGSDKRSKNTATCLSICLVNSLHSNNFKALLDKFPQSKRFFEHAYVARMVAFQVKSSSEEKASLDGFYGSATPHTDAAIESMLGAEVHSVFKNLCPRKGIETLSPIA